MFEINKKKIKKMLFFVVATWALPVIIFCEIFVSPLLYAIEINKKEIGQACLLFTALAYLISILVSLPFIDFYKMLFSPLRTINHRSPFYKFL